MIPKCFYSKYLFLFTAIIAFATVFFADIGKAAKVTSPTVDPTLPVYNPGTTFIFGDGSWETVLNATADRVEWKNHKGEQYSGSPDFTRRPSFWQNRKREVRRTYEKRADLFFKPPISLWPLHKGGKAGFLEEGRWTDKEGSNRSYSAHWACEVVSKGVVSVPAGTFDSWEIECRRFSVSSNLKSVLRQVNRWYYSPRIGHYVLKIKHYSSGKPSQRNELVAVIPPYKMMSPTVKQRIERSFQAALEKNNRDESMEWQYKQEQLSGTTKPTDTYRLSDGTYCRRYTQTINKFPNIYYGVACRNSQGIWYVPRK